jgi:hypothetical protein
VAGDRRQPGGAHGSVGRLDRPRAPTQAARGHHPRHGQLREPDPRRAGRLGLERSLRLHLLPPAVRVQSVRRSGALPAPARQRPQCRGLAPGAGAGERPLPRAGRRSLLPRRCGLRQAGIVRAAGAGRHPLRDPAPGQPGVAAADRPFADAAGRPAAQEADREPMPASTTRPPAGPEPVGWWPRSSGTRASSTHGSASS